MTFVVPTIAMSHAQHMRIVDHHKCGNIKRCTTNRCRHCRGLECKQSWAILLSGKHIMGYGNPNAFDMRTYLTDVCGIPSRDITFTMNEPDNFDDEAFNGL
jgi:hypothetical protein